MYMSRFAPTNITLESRLNFFSSPSGSWQTLILTEERRVLVVPIPFRYRTQTIMRQVASSARGREKKKESKKGTEEKNIYMRED